MYGDVQEARTEKRSNELPKTVAAAVAVTLTCTVFACVGGAPVLALVFVFSGKKTVGTG